MEKGKVIEWLKQEGETLAKGEPMVVIETDKVVTEVEAPVDSVLVRIVVGQEEERPIGATLALLGSPGERLSDAEIDQLLGDESAAAPSAKGAVASVAVRAPAAPSARVKISPMARKLAQEYRIDAATVAGTGPGGRVTKDDILRAVEAAKTSEPASSEPAPVSTPASTPAAWVIPLTGIRGRVAERMYESWNTIPRVTEVMHVDMSATVAFREAMQSQWEQQFGVRISLNDLITKAVAVALSRHPRLNATMGEREIQVHEQINIGVAVNLDEGLIVPVVRHVDRKDLGQFARASRELDERSRSGRLQLDDLSDGTFTITNLGTAGIDLFTPIINPPQVAILGVGRIQRRPVVVGDALAIRPSAYLCLVFDHRALDGVPAARFLQELQQLLAKPQDYAV
jgi:pyruvate dehydrogenase E2 component (dihydrolipoamide acetyltransferase)